MKKDIGNWIITRAADIDAHVVLLVQLQIEAGRVHIPPRVQMQAPWLVLLVELHEEAAMNCSTFYSCPFVRAGLLRHWHHLHVCWLRHPLCFKTGSSRVSIKKNKRKKKIFLFRTT